MPQFAGQHRKIKLRRAAGVLAGSALVVVVGATSAVAAPDRAPEAVSAIANKDWQYCEADIVRNGTVYVHPVVRKKGYGKNVKIRPLSGQLRYTRSTKPAVYLSLRAQGRCRNRCGRQHAPQFGTPHGVARPSA